MPDTQASIVAVDPGGLSQMTFSTLSTLLLAPIRVQEELVRDGKLTGVVKA